MVRETREDQVVHRTPQGTFPIYVVTLRGGHVWGPLWRVERETYYDDGMWVRIPTIERRYQLGRKQWLRKYEEWADE